MAVDLAGGDNVSSRSDVCVHVCVCAHVCAHVCASVISGLSIFLRIYVNPLSTFHLCSRRSKFIFVMWDYLSVYFYANNVARGETSKSRISLEPPIIT